LRYEQLLQKKQEEKKLKERLKESDGGQFDELIEEIKKKSKEMDKLEKRLEKLKTKCIRNILIVGEEGKGKSTLANVLSDSNYFDENHGGNRIKRVRDKIFDVD
jgi:DNA-binding NtrC family response regulator